MRKGLHSTLREREKVTLRGNVTLLSLIREN
jgi:hypothetical protein